MRLVSIRILWTLFTVLIKGSSDPEVVDLPGCNSSCLFFFNQQLVLPVLTIADKNSALNPFTHVQVKLGQDVTRRWWLCGRGWKKKADKRQTEASVSVTRVGLRLFNNLFLLIKPQKLKATLVGFFYLLTHVNWRGGGKQHPRTRMLTLIAHSGRTPYPSAARGSISLSLLHTNTF